MEFEDGVSRYHNRFFTLLYMTLFDYGLVIPFIIKKKHLLFRLYVVHIWMSRKIF